MAAQITSNPYKMHCSLLQAFPDADNGGPGRVLFRVEPSIAGTAREITVLVQSDIAPDWSRMLRNLSTRSLLDAPELRKLPKTFKEGTILRFRLRGNPTVRRTRLPDGSRDTRRRRPRHPLYREEDQLQWLVRRGRMQGFELRELPFADLSRIGASCAQYDIVVRNEGTVVSGKPTKKGISRHHSVLYEGVMRVTEQTAFEDALIHGIGPGKAFGFGLLSVAIISEH